jgi:exosortase A
VAFGISPDTFKKQCEGLRTRYPDYISTTFTHGFVVLPIALWLVWHRRDRLRAIEPRPWFAMLPLIGLVGVAWLVGEMATVNALSQTAFVVIVILSVPAILGREVARTITFPLAFLLFAVPAGDFLLPTLMDRTADFTVLALRATGVPVYREGFLIVVPNGRWSIVEACSGIRYLIASLVAGTLFAYLNYRANWRRWVFVGISAIVPIVANWVRAYLIVLLGYLSDNRIAAGVDHLFTAGSSSVS